MSARETVTFDFASGVRPEDATVLFAQAAAFHAQLADDLTAWPARFDAAERRSFAASRRRLLHRLLDRALDAVELIEEAERGVWP